MTKFPIYRPDFQSRGAARYRSYSQTRSCSLSQSQSNAELLDTAVTAERGASRRCSHSRTRSVSASQSQPNRARSVHKNNGRPGKVGLISHVVPTCGERWLAKEKEKLSSLRGRYPAWTGYPLRRREFFTRTVSRSRMRSIRVRRASR